MHIGYAKTATTYLQTLVFPRLDSVNYIGRSYGKGLPPSQNTDWVNEFVFEDGVSMKKFADIIQHSVDATSKHNMISHENFLRPYKRDRFLQRLKCLKRYFGEIKIIVSIRNQTDLVLSRYVHDRKLIASRSIVDALDFSGETECLYPYCWRSEVVHANQGPCFCVRNTVKFVNIPFYDYWNLQCQLAAFFGKNNIHFILHENLLDEPKKEIDRLTDFLNIEHLNGHLMDEIAERRENVQQNRVLYDEIKVDYVSSGMKERVFEFF